jgi:HPt (histidine-containing phosphotransfer) domain-containing protein
MQTPTENAAGGAESINLDGFREAVGGDESERIELLELYVDQIKTKIPLAAAALKNNLSELARITHTLTGSTSTCGLDELATHLRALHAAAKADNQSAAEAVFPQVAAYAARVQSAIEQELARCKNQP